MDVLKQAVLCQSFSNFPLTFNFIVKLQELKHVCDSLEKRNANKEDVVFPQTVFVLWVSVA